MKNEKILNFFSVFVALVSIIFYGVRAIFLAPDTKTEPFQLNQQRKRQFNLYPNCCIATSFSKNNIDNLLLLGYSLNNVGVIPPKLYAFTNDQNLDLHLRAKIEKFFKIVDNYSFHNSYKFLEGYYWDYLQQESCFPVISVTVNGVFNKSPWEISNYVFNKTLPAAVPLHGDMLNGDSNLFVFDPNDKPKGVNSLESYINSYDNWTPLPSEFHVNDYENEFLDFWTRYGNPTFISYSYSTFRNLVSGTKKHADGSFRLYKIMQMIYNNWKRDSSK